MELAFLGLETAIHYASDNEPELRQRYWNVYIFQEGELCFITDYRPQNVTLHCRFWCGKLTRISYAAKKVV